MNELHTGTKSENEMVEHTECITTCYAQSSNLSKLIGCRCGSGYECMLCGIPTGIHMVSEC